MIHSLTRGKVHKQDCFHNKRGCSSLGCFQVSPSPQPRTAPQMKPPRRHGHIVPICRLLPIGGALQCCPEGRRHREGQRGAAGAVERGAGPRGGDRGDRFRGGGGAGDGTYR